jgi:transcriptional regulator with XRE-family HTH domain
MKEVAAVKFGKVIRNLRKERNWTQYDLAAEMEVDAAFISRIERGRKVPSLETILRLAQALKVSVLFGDKKL